MASATIGSLRVNLGIDTAAFNTGLSQATSKWSAFGGVLRKAAIPLATAATAAAVGIGVVVKSTINAADEMSKAAQKFGIPIETLSRLKYAADLSDVSMETLGTGVARLSKQMVEADGGTKSAVEAFQKLGIAFEDSEGKLRPTEAVLADLAAATAALPEGAAQATAGVELMGKSWKELVPLFAQGGDALRKTMAEASTFGQVFDQAMGKQAEQFNDNITRLQGAFGNLAADLTQKLLPYLADFTDWLVENGPQVASAVAVFVKFAAEIAKLAVAVGSAQAKFIEFNIKAVQAVLDMIARIGEAIARLRDKFVQLGKDIMAGLWEGLKAGASAIIDWMSGFATGLWNKAREAVGAKSPATKFIELGTDILGGLLIGLQSSKGPVYSEMEGIASKLGDGFSKGFVDKVKKGLKGLGKSLGLTGGAAGGIVGDIGTSIAGSIGSMVNGSDPAWGAGIGAAIGTAFGPIGSILGSALGGLADKIFGGGEPSKWQRPRGTAFQGTTFASDVMGSRNVNVEAGASQAGKFAFQGTVNLLADFNKELGEYVDSLGGTMERGLKLVVNNDAALKRITGTISDRTVNRGSESEDDAAARISKRVSEIMGLAAALAQNAGPALTETQTLWRETQERFSKTNVLILKDLGFASKEIKKLQGDIKDDLREGFEKGMLDSLVDSGRASRKEIDAWRKYELDSLGERRAAAVRTAKETGASVALVNSAFKAERRDILKEWRELLADMEKDTGDTAARLRALNERANRLESKRSGILQELTRRSGEALQAEEALRDARRGLAGGALNPGGPRDVFAALKSQFAQAINAAKGGDADAASRAAGLASALLESGRGVFASGTDYAKLFKDVNASLLGAAKDFDKRGDKLAKALDDKTFKDVQERSTKALLVGLQRLDERLEEVAHEIKRQTRETRRDGQRKSVG